MGPSGTKRTTSTVSARVTHRVGSVRGARGCGQHRGGASGSEDVRCGASGVRGVSGAGVQGGSQYHSPGGITGVQLKARQSEDWTYCTQPARKSASATVSSVRVTNCGSWGRGCGRRRRMRRRAARDRSACCDSGCDGITCKGTASAKTGRGVQHRGNATIAHGQGWWKRRPDEQNKVVRTSLNQP